jgi:hypothetical protein
VAHYKAKKRKLQKSSSHTKRHKNSGGKPHFLICSFLYSFISSLLLISSVVKSRKCRKERKIKERTSQEEGLAPANQ